MSAQSDALTSRVQALFREQFNAFAEWVDENWKTEPRDTIDDGMTPEMREGWDRCCASIKTAYQCWVDEIEP